MGDGVSMSYKVGGKEFSFEVYMINSIRSDTVNGSVCNFCSQTFSGRGYAANLVNKFDGMKKELVLFCPSCLSRCLGVDESDLFQYLCSVGCVSPA